MPHSRLVLHIGMHKTGTTSIQEYLFRHRATFSARGLVFPQGELMPSNHVELHIAAMKGDRQSPFKFLANMKAPEPAFLERTQAWVSRALSLGGSTTIFSAEGLSYLRFPEEIDWIANVFQDRVPEVIVFRRDPDAFLRSYRKQLDRLSIAHSSDPDSFAYVQEDSWVADVDGLVAAYARRFPVRVVDYDEAMNLFGSVIPAFLQTINIDPDTAPDWRGVWENATQ